MEKQKYITDEEREKCRKVAEVFAELEDNNIIVCDLGRYGFIKLEYSENSHIFEDIITFTDSKALFEDLWDEWKYVQADMFAKDTPLEKLDTEEIIECMPKEKQKELKDRKVYFAERTGIKEILSSFL